MWRIALLLLLGVALASARAEALQVVQPGYIAAPYKSLTEFAHYADVEADNAGNLFVATCNGGFLKVDAAKIVSPWSSAVGCDLALSPSGTSYAAGAALCHCIQSISSDGAYESLHEDTFEWTWVEMTSSGALYANVWAGPGQGLYSVNPVSGEVTPIVGGGPGAGGAGWYNGMTVGADGQLYVIGYDGASAWKVFRLDGQGLTEVAILPNGGLFLSEGPSGSLLVSIKFPSGGGVTIGELWIVDPISGTTTLMATSTGDYGFDGVGFDGATGRIYVIEGHKIWLVQKDPTSVAPTSWGSLKATYRK